METNTDPVTAPPSTRDKRLGLVSASGYETDAMCLGRQNLLPLLPPEAFQKPVEEVTDRGTVIHAARETGDVSNLEEEDRETYLRGVAAETEAFGKWLDDFGLRNDGEPPKEQLEERFYLYWPDTMKPATSARLDVFYICGDHGVIMEWKAMFCNNLTPAERNHQGRLQAVLLAKEHSLKHVRVCFVKAKYGEVDTVDYTANDLAYAEASIFNTLWQIKQPEAPRSAGNHCRYCPAKGAYCAESQAWALLPSVIASRAIGNAPENLNPSLAKPSELVARMSLADCAMVQSRQSVIIKVLDEVKNRLKKLPEQELRELGYELVPGRKTQSITNPSACFQELSDVLKLPVEYIWKGVKFNKGETVEALQLHWGWGKKEAEGYFNQLVAKYGEVKESDKSLSII